MVIQDLLTAWGKGRAISDPPNGYPSQAPFARLIARGNVGLPKLPDEAHGRVDGAVSDLRLKKPLHHAIIVKSYIGRLTDAQIARQISKAEKRPTSRSTVRGIRIAAEHWIEGRLDA